MIGKPVYHWHSKLSMKKPASAGRWDWHQDYGYWYDEGCLAPDMTTCMIAVDRTDRANGCVELIRGSHLLGRIDHKAVGKA
ncbi:MAG TPA: phytanoyl-CoA dioxygenase family protein, partial [Dongiaceae bacterium]